VVACVDDRKTPPLATDVDALIIRRIENNAEPTALLRSWRAGDRASLDRLLPLLYQELARVARRAMGGERAGHTLQTRALVHEAYLRLIDADVTQIVLAADQSHVAQNLNGTSTTKWNELGAHKNYLDQPDWLIFTLIFSVVPGHCQAASPMKEKGFVS